MEKRHDTHLVFFPSSLLQLIVVIRHYMVDRYSTWILIKAQIMFYCAHIRHSLRFIVTHNNCMLGCQSFKNQSINKFNQSIRLCVLDIISFKENLVYFQNINFNNKIIKHPPLLHFYSMLNLKTFKRKCIRHSPWMMAFPQTRAKHKDVATKCLRCKNWGMGRV
jgi:hypothetical protein